MTDPFEKYVASPPKKCTVCGGPFSPEKPAITKEFTGEYYAFCSAECMGAFEGDPEKFARLDEEDENGD
ncbi:YHS domain-containing protein [Candidatus Uhrbacteria bacterium]|nr:YHS domain-containing protein [Candidatus Uhrbacteria bacterium]